MTSARSNSGSANDSLPYSNVNSMNRIEGLLKRLNDMVTLLSTCFSDLCTHVSREVFLNMLRSHHCLNHLLPAYRSLDALRPRGHNFILPECLTLSSLHKRSFIVSCLYEFVWFFFLFIYSLYTSHVHFPGLLPLLVQCSVFCYVPLSTHVCASVTFHNLVSCKCDSKKKQFTREIWDF